jgi:hypothetical protein
LRPAAALDVVVVGDADRPVEQARVEVTTGDPLPFVARTDEHGKARLDRLGPSPYLVRVSARGYDDLVRTGVVVGAGPLRIKLERTGTLVVKVVGEDGAPVAGATVLAAGSGLWPPRSTVTEGGGSARITGLRSGVYDLKAREGDRVSETEIGVSLARAETKEVELTLKPGRRVTVKVVDGEANDAPPIRDAAVVLVEQGLSSFPLEGRTGEAGAVVLGPIARGVASVSARARGFVPKSAVLVGANVTEVRVPLLRGGVLAGDVVDDRGYPVGGATIEVVGVDSEGLPIDETSSLADFRADHFESQLGGPLPLLPIGELGVMPGPIPDLPRDGAPIVPRSSSAGDPWVTRGDGTFRCDPVPPGRVHVIVRHPSYVEATSEVVTLRSGAEARVHVVLTRGGTLEGRVLEEDRTPVAGARIELAATKGSLERIVYAADDGTFAFAAISDEVVLSVARPDAPADIVAHATVSVPEGERREIEIVLPKLRETVALRVTDDRGYPIGRVEVRALAMDPKVPLRKTTFTNDDGSTEIRDAVGLPLRITLVRPSKAPRVESIESAPAKLDLSMKEGITAKGSVTARDGRDRVAGAEVTLYTAVGARHVRTDGQGDFAVSDLAPGRVRLVVTHEEFARTETYKSIPDGADRADLGAVDLAEAGEVEGVVVDDKDQPVQGARVARDAVPTYLPLGPLPSWIAACDREGRFLLKGLPAGDVKLEAYSADHGRGFIEHVAVRAGRTTSRIKIALPEEATPSRDPKGAGNVAVTLAERTEHGEKIVLVAMVPAGSEAEAAGIEPGDRFVTINGRPARTIEEARDRLSGPIAEDVIIEVSRESEDGTKSWLTRVRRERVRR